MLSSVEGFLVSIYNCSTIKGATTSSFRGAVKEMTRQKNHHEFHFFYAVDYTAKFYIFHEMNVSNCVMLGKLRVAGVQGTNVIWLLMWAVSSSNLQLKIHEMIPCILFTLQI